MTKQEYKELRKLVRQNGVYAYRWANIKNDADAFDVAALKQLHNERDKLADKLSYAELTKH